MEQGVLYYYLHEDGKMTVSDMFYTYDYSDKIYKWFNGTILLIMEDKWVLDEPREIDYKDWCLILLKSNGVTRPEHI